MTGRIWFYMTSVIFTCENLERNTCGSSSDTALILKYIHGVVLNLLHALIALSLGMEQYYHRMHWTSMHQPTNSGRNVDQQDKKDTNSTLYDQFSTRQLIYQQHHKIFYNQIILFVIIWRNLECHETI